MTSDASSLNSAYSVSRFYLTAEKSSKNKVKEKVKSTIIFCGQTYEVFYDKNKAPYIELSYADLVRFKGQIEANNRKLYEKIFLNSKLTGVMYPRVYVDQSTLKTEYYALIEENLPNGRGKVQKEYPVYWKNTKPPLSGPYIMRFYPHSSTRWGEVLEGGMENPEDIKEDQATYRIICTNEKGEKKEAYLELKCLNKGENEKEEVKFEAKWYYVGEPFGIFRYYLTPKEIKSIKKEVIKADNA